MSTGYVNIKGIDKVELLYALWYNMRRVSCENINSMMKLQQIQPIIQPTFDFTLANNVICGYIDEFMGVAIKSDLSKDSVNPNEYDSYAHKKGLFKEVVDGITYRKLTDDNESDADACRCIKSLAMN